MRLFFALWPPEDTALALERWAAPLKGRRVPAGNIHMTLAFLGEADPAKAGAAARRAQGMAFRLPIEEARHWAHNDIVWAAPRSMPVGLQQLVESLQLELFKAGFILERRPFAAHVTLLRKAQPQMLPPLPTAVEWPVKEFCLMSSTPTGHSAAYRRVEAFPLA
jgi:2'-5' RNA ligase